MLSMKRLIVICEGSTEQEFCKDVLLPYFLNKNILIDYPTLKKSNGGIVKWDALRRQVENHLRQERYAVVTTFIDLYALPDDYPDSVHGNADTIQIGMKAGIDPALSHRFIPYIQRHEFECFIFASIDVLRNNFKAHEADFTAIECTVSRHPHNLEDINNSPLTAPSKRLLQAIKGYDKIVYGACLAAEIGLDTIRQKCPRFHAWLTLLESI